MTRGFSLFLIALAGLGLAPAAYAQSGALPDDMPKVNVSFVAEKTAVAPGGSVTVALNQAIRKNWHTYWVNPGDSGAATAIKWQLPPGWSVGSMQWPYPEKLPVGPLMNFGYAGNAALLMDVTAPKDAVPGQTATLGADVTWLVCSDVCVPEQAHLTLPVAVAAATPPPDESEKPFFAAARAKLPAASPWPAIYDASDKRFALLVESSSLASAATREAVFYPAADGYAASAAPQAVGMSPRGLVIESAPGWKLATAEKRKTAGAFPGVLVLTGADGTTQALALDIVPGSVPPTEALFAQSSGLTLIEAVIFAFIGGLILNLMPCVFPVLSMKALALAAKAGAPDKAKAAALGYGAGVIATFLVLAGVLLALRGEGAALGWGFQLQQPGFVLALALLMLAVGLNLSGLFEIGGGLMGLGGTLAGGSGVKGNFFTGALAVVVATPCTAPFMAAALGFALTASAPIALAVFFALGVGFALPFVALGFWPRALRALPRPGPWMIALKHWLALPMYGAALWLLWVLSQQTGWRGVEAALSAGAALTAALWFYGKREGGRGYGIATALGVVLTVGVASWAGVQAAPPTATERGVLSYEPYSAARLAALRAEGRPVFVNATAAWCITCLVNEKVALSSGDLKRAFAEKKIAALKADWTNQDPEITRLLAAEGRSGVPLYLYFAPRAEKPVILPQLLTPAGVMTALESP